MKRIFTIGFFGVVGLVLVLLLFNSPRSSVSVPIPKPNGYDDLVKAGRIIGSDPPVVDDLSTQELQAFVGRNANAFRLAHAGMQKPSRVPVEYSMEYASNHLADLTSFKRMVRGFLAEGKLAERENRRNEAASAYLDAIRLGHECSRGGVIVDMLVGVACRSAGCQALQGLGGHMQAPEYRETIQHLEEMEAKAESAPEIIERERAWGRRTFGLQGRVAALLMRQRLAQINQNAITKLQAQQKTERLLLMDLAARAYELEKGQRPRTVADLVPVYLNAVPRDPLTGTSIALP